MAAERIDILECILKGVLLEDALERINLNLPTEARRALLGIAKRLRKTESAVARELLLEAIERARREEFYRQAEGSMTPDLRRRQLEIVDAFEKAR